MRLDIVHPGFIQSPAENLSRLYFERSEKGVTLIELVISLALGLVLIMGITRVYIENKRNYVFDEEVARMQENGEFALGILKKELSMQGFFSGAVPQFTGAVSIAGDCSHQWAFNPLFPLDFINDAGAVSGGVLKTSAAGVTMSGCINASALEPGNDVITLKRLAAMPTIVNGVYQGGLLGGQEKKNTWYVQLQDYQHPAFVYVDNGFDKADKAPSNKVSMWVYLVRIFFVRKYSVSASELPAIPTLMMASLRDGALVSSAQPAVALVEGVERLHLEFGVPDAMGKLVFTANPSDIQIANATIARIYLLMRTRNPVREYVDKKSYKLGSLQPFKPEGKHYVRRVFSTTVRLRNNFNSSISQVRLK